MQQAVDLHEETRHRQLRQAVDLHEEARHRQLRRAVDLHEEAGHRQLQQAVDLYEEMRLVRTLKFSLRIKNLLLMSHLHTHISSEKTVVCLRLVPDYIYRVRNFGIFAVFTCISLELQVRTGSNLETRYHPRPQKYLNTSAVRNNGP